MGTAFEALAETVLKWAVLAAVAMSTVLRLLGIDAPASEYWFTLDAANYLGGFFLSVVLGVMGIALTNIPRHLVVTGLIGLSIVMVVGLWSSAQKTRETVELKRDLTSTSREVGSMQDELVRVRSELAKATGADSYCFIWLRAPTTAAASYPTQLVCPNPINSNLSVTVHPLREDGTPNGPSTEKVFLGPILDSSYNDASPALPLGSFRIEFKAVASRWSENLKIELSSDFLNLNGAVTRDGITLRPLAQQIPIGMKTDGQGR